ncbi:DNA circularization N-terminal domain-containing protein [Limnohabitans sp.]|uniref:DNA circularization N-terminal domain-containing protein n=1 Tax=Limnohabitans sp. TaxID=1907725 RepID=UPI00286F4E19|nr:DNA circularization N-terminal domain-containing protein [Limnohabitans sp.]
MSSADWSTRQSYAKWRGFEFLTDSHDSTHGARLVVTELPGADEPVVEDMGAKADGYKVAAYFIGADYDLQRNKFLSLLAQGGAAWLRHPWLGDVWVRAHNWSVHESTDKGGFCTVSVDFVPGGQAPFVPMRDMADTALGAIDKTAKASPFAFLKMTAAAVSKFVAQVQGKLDLVRDALAMARMPLTMATQVMGAVASAKAVVGDVMAMPGEYATMMRTLASSLGLSATDDLSEVSRVRVVTALSRQAAASAREDFSAVVPPALQANMKADAVMRSTLMVASAMTLALTDYTTAEARDTAQAVVLDALEVVMPLMPDTLFYEAANARAAFVAALQAQVLDGKSVDVVAALPSVVVAYEQGVDEAVLLERNAVRHPLFVQGRIRV